MIIIIMMIIIIIIITITDYSLMFLSFGIITSIGKIYSKLYSTICRTSDVLMVIIIKNNKNIQLNR